MERGEDTKTGKKGRERENNVCAPLLRALLSSMGFSRSTADRLLKTTTLIDEPISLGRRLMKSEIN